MELRKKWLSEIEKTEHGSGQKGHKSVKKNFENFIILEVS